MKVSVCIAAHHKLDTLRAVLKSIWRQSPPFTFEVIVADDSGEACKDRRPWLHHLATQYIPLPNTGYRNPSAARNVAYREATGEIVICQSDDVVHQGEAMSELVGALSPGHFVIADVRNTTTTGQPVASPLYHLTGPQNPRPFFFLGALYRKDLFAVGGNDEDFVEPGYDDNRFADSLMRGLGLRPIFTSKAVGHHIAHDRPADLWERQAISQRLYVTKTAAASTGKGSWLSPGAPWPYQED